MHDPTEVDGGDGLPTRSGLRLAALLVAAVLTAVLLGQVTDLVSPHRLTAAVITASPSLAGTPENQRVDSESIKRCPVPLGGLALRSHPQVSAWTFERWDCRALQGPWSVVIRAKGGHLGVHSAVATFPVEIAASGSPAARPEGARWNPEVARLVWPLAGSHAQIVGDVGKTELMDLAMRITVEAGKPRLQGHLPALDGFSTAAIVTYRSALLHEMRYSAVDLGQESKLGDSLVYTGVMSGASLESQALASGTKPAGFVRGKPAIYSDVPGGNGNLVWESAPGQVTYIGYSGSAVRAGAIETLRALADRGRPLTPIQWQAKDRIRVGGDRADSSG